MTTEWRDTRVDRDVAGAPSSTRDFGLLDPTEVTLADEAPSLSRDLARADLLQAEAILDYLAGRPAIDELTRDVRPAPRWVRAAEAVHSCGRRPVTFGVDS